FCRKMSSRIPNREIDYSYCGGDWPRSAVTIKHPKGCSMNQVHGKLVLRHSLHKRSFDRSSRTQHGAHVYRVFQRGLGVVEIPSQHEGGHRSPVKARIDGVSSRETIWIVNNEVPP